ncbi:MAG: hypothetical protein ABL949_17255, partial [Fimbriimonadaceae bacterium]
MNSENQHPKDPLINLELEALRTVTPAESSVSRAAMSFTEPLSSNSPRRLVWSLGTVTALTMVGILAIPLLPRQADAAEVYKIAQAQKDQKTRYCRSFQRCGDGELILIYEEWLDGAKHTQKFYDTSGSVSGMNGFNGKLNFMYWIDAASTGQGRVDDYGAMGIPLETIDSYLNIPALKTFTHQPRVKVEGKVYDYYTFGKNATYRLYVDPSTRLPMRREIFSKGEIIERDFYEYPATIEASTFDTPKIKGVEFYDYAKERPKFVENLKKRGPTQMVAGTTVELKAVLRGNHDVTVVWSGTEQLGPPEGSAAFGVAERKQLFRHAVEVVGMNSRYGTFKSLTTSSGGKLSVVRVDGTQ